MTNGRLGRRAAGISSGLATWRRALLLALVVVCSPTAIATAQNAPASTFRVSIAGDVGLSLHRVVRTDVVRYRTPAQGPGRFDRGVAINETEVRSEFELACVAPCTLALPRGSYRVGIGSPGGEIQRLDEALLVESDLDLRLEYDDRDVLRVVGWGVLALGAGMTVGCIVATDRASTGREADSWTITAVVSVIVGLAVGFPLATISDAATLRVTPAGIAF